MCEDERLKEAIAKIRSEKIAENQQRLEQVLASGEPQKLVEQHIESIIPVNPEEAETIREGVRCSIKYYKGKYFLYNNTVGFFAPAFTLEDIESAFSEIEADR